MLEELSDPGRRRFLQCSSALLLIPLLNVPSVSAQTPSPLDESNSTALALSYKKNQEEAKKVEGYQEGRRCDNCVLYVQNDSGCKLFPGFSVEAAGWCKAWAPAS